MNLDTNVNHTVRQSSGSLYYKWSLDGFIAANSRHIINRKLSHGMYCLTFLFYMRPLLFCPRAISSIFVNVVKCS